MSKQNRFETELVERQRRIDVLIDHYEKFGPPGAGSVIQVDCTIDDLPFACRDEKGAFHYRGRILVPVGRKAMTKREFQQRHARI